MSRYWKCTMTNDEDSFRVGDIYETDDEKRNFVDGTYFYFVEQCIDELSVASFEEIIEETKDELKMQKYGDKYWKCTYSEGDWFKEGKIYITDVNGRNATNEFGMKLEGSIPNEFIPNCTFKEVSHDDWMEQEYKAYYDEEEKMKRNGKCVNTSYRGFIRGKVYETDQNKQNYVYDTGYDWSNTPIDELRSASFEEVNDGGDELDELETKMKRYWKCITSDYEVDFTVGKIYISDGNKLNYKDNTNYIWRSTPIDSENDYAFEEVTEYGEALNYKPTESNKDMVNHPTHYNSNSKGTTNDSDRHMEICTSLNETFKKKNSDYGNSFSKSYEIFGMVGATSRIYDKMNRLLSLTVESKEREVDDEPIEDTLLDMANYCILTYMELTREENE